MTLVLQALAQGFIIVMYVQQRRSQKRDVKWCLAVLKVLLCPFSHFEFQEKRQDTVTQSNTHKFAELIRSPVRSLWGNPPSLPAKFPDIWSLALGSKLLLLLAELFWLNILSLRWSDSSSITTCLSWWSWPFLLGGSLGPFQESRTNVCDALTW